MIKDKEGLRDRFLQFPDQVRMGHLASDLLRVSGWARQRDSDEMAVDLMNMIAWMLESIPSFASEELANMQREICHWRRIWPIEPARGLLTLRTRIMSDRILELSGLLDEGTAEPVAGGATGGKGV